MLNSNGGTINWSISELGLEVDPGNHLSLSTRATRPAVRSSFHACGKSTTWCGLESLIEIGCMQFSSSISDLCLIYISRHNYGYPQEMQLLEWPIY
jgi:hypothetical protein